MKIRAKIDGANKSLTPSHPTKAAKLPSNPVAKPRFRIHAHLQVPVAAEVIVHANTPEEAQDVAEGILRGDSFIAQLHGIIDVQTISVQPDHRDVRLESVVSEPPPEPFVWSVVDLGLSKACGPDLQSLLCEQAETFSPDKGTVEKEDLQP